MTQTHMMKNINHKSEKKTNQCNVMQSYLSMNVRCKLYGCSEVTLIYHITFISIKHISDLLSDNIQLESLRTCTSPLHIPTPTHRHLYKCRAIHSAASRFLPRKMTHSNGSHFCSHTTVHQMGSRQRLVVHT